MMNVSIDITIRRTKDSLLFIFQVEVLLSGHQNLLICRPEFLKK